MKVSDYFENMNKEAKAFAIQMLSRQRVEARVEYIQQQYKCEGGQFSLCIPFPWFVGGNHPRSLPVWLFQTRDERGRFGPCSDY